MQQRTAIITKEVKVPVKVINKRGELVDFDISKVIDAASRAAFRTDIPLNSEEIDSLVDYVVENIGDKDIHTYRLHVVVENGLKEIRPDVAKLYRNYRDYKREDAKKLADLYETTESIKHDGMTENANKDSALISTRGSLLREITAKELVRNYMLTESWKEAHDEGNIYIHDLGDLISGSFNCCLSDMGNLIHKKENSKYAFEINGNEYTQPKHVLSLFNLLGDLTLALSSNQFGGYTIPEIDTIASYYCASSYDLKFKEYLISLHGDEYAEFINKIDSADTNAKIMRQLGDFLDLKSLKLARKLAMKDTEYEIKQGIQGFTLKITSCGNALGQTPFSTITFGLDTNFWARKVSLEILRQRSEPSCKLVFPKLVFLYREEIHADEKAPNHDLFEAAMKCSATKLYPDYLSVSEGFLKDIYESTGGTQGSLESTGKLFQAGMGEEFGSYGDRSLTYKWSIDENHMLQTAGQVVSPMGCRAYLNAYDNAEYDSNRVSRDIFTGRGNLSAVTLNLTKYAIESQGDWNKFYELIDKYMNLALDFQQWRYKECGSMLGSSNPLLWCHGGAWDSVGPDDKVQRLTDTFSASVGYLGMNEACNFMFMANAEQGEYDPSVDRKSTKTNYVRKYSHMKNYTLPGYEEDGLRHEKYAEILNFMNDIKLRRIEADKELHIDEKGNEYLFTPRYTLYGTPAESLVFKHMNMLRDEYGVIPNVTDREYLTNSFHVPVWVDIDAVDKVAFESEFHQISTGGHISYTEFTYGVSTSVLQPIIEYAMRCGTYFGVNVIAGTCNDCGYQGDFVEECPHCKSNDVISLNRVCGYLSVSSRKGKAVVNPGKAQEILDRVDHYGNGSSLRDTEKCGGEKFLSTTRSTVV